MALLKAALVLSAAAATTAQADVQTFTGRLNPMIVDTFQHSSEPAPTLYEFTADGKTYVLTGLDAADSKNLVPNDLGYSGDITIEGERMPGNTLAVAKVVSFHQQPYQLRKDPLEVSKALVMVLTFGGTDNEDPMAKANEFAADVSKAFHDNSWGKKTFDVDIDKDGKPDVIGPIKVTDQPPKMQCMASIWADNADKVAIEKYGIDFNDYNHRIYYYDTYLKCGWEGLGYVGCTKEPEGKCRTYMNTENPRYDDQKAKAIWVHEIGHNLGLRHARKGRSDYGDRSDPMGKAKLIHFNGAHSDKLGYLEVTAGSYKDIENLKGSTVTLNAMTDSSTEGLTKVLRYGKASKSGDLYYAQLRVMEGIDVLIEDDEYYDKVIIHKLHVGDGKNNKSEFVKVLKDGESFSAGGFTLTVEPSFDKGTKQIRID